MEIYIRRAWQETKVLKNCWACRSNKSIIKIGTAESKAAEVLNNFFLNIVKNLKIPEYDNSNPSFANSVWD